MKNKLKVLVSLFLWSFLLFATFLFRNILSLFIEPSIYNQFAHPQIRLMTMYIIGAALLPMISVTLFIGIIGGSVLKGNKYSGFLAAIAYCGAWNFMAGIEFWTSTTWSIPALLLHISIPFIGGYVYAWKLGTVHYKNGNLHKQ